MKKRQIAIIVLKQYNCCTEELHFLFNSFFGLCSKLFVLDLFDFVHKYPAFFEAQSGLEIFSDLNLLLERLRSESANADEQNILITDNSYFGPFESWGNIFQIMDERNLDVWGLEYKDGCIQSSLMSLKKDVFWDAELQKYFCQNGLHVKPDFMKILKEKGYTYDTYLRENDVAVTDKSLLAPYELIKNEHFPILYKDALNSDRIALLEYHYADELSKAVKYIEKETSYPEENIYNYLLENFDPGEIKRILNLNYIIDGTGSHSSDRFNAETAIGMHLFYEDLFETDAIYIKKIPQDINIYITVKSEDARYELYKILGESPNVHIIISSGIGRDWGALIIDLWPFLKNYNYICFVHDKKTTWNNRSSLIGTAFMQMVWGNLIPDAAFIEQTVCLLHEEKQLGFLTPPVPYHNSYVRLLGDSWTVCYEKTMEVAKDLKLSVDISQSKIPFALSSMFWFKKEALLPVFEHNFHEEDFPKEPMEKDGTLNHALERIVIYVAANQGFFSGTVQSKSIAENNILNYEMMLEREIGFSLRFFKSITLGGLMSKAGQENLYELIRFVSSNKKISIYGAGKIGKYLAEFLGKMGVQYEFFIVSDTQEKPDRVLDHKVVYLSEVSEDTNIIVAANEMNLKEIENNLKACGKYNYFLFHKF